MFSLFSISEFMSNSAIFSVLKYSTFQFCGFFRQLCEISLQSNFFKNTLDVLINCVNSVDHISSYLHDGTVGVSVEIIVFKGDLSNFSFQKQVLWSICKIFFH